MPLEIYVITTMTYDNDGIGRLVKTLYSYEW